MLAYGKVVTEIGYKDGNAVNQLRRTEESIAVNSRQELFDHILEQLKKLDTCDEVTFTVVADRQTHQPARIVVINEERL